jgi:hypothetical protein
VTLEINKIILAPAYSDDIKDKRDKISEGDPTKMFGLLGLSTAKVTFTYSHSFKIERQKLYLFFH